MNVPYSQQSEEFIIGSAVGGALTGDGESVINILTMDHFYGRNCSISWGVIQDLFNNNSPIDIFSFSEALNSNGKLKEVGGYAWIHGLTKHFYTISTVQFHADILKEKYRLRKLLEITCEVTEKVLRNEDSKTILNDSEARLFELGNETVSNENSLIEASNSLKILIDKRLNRENVEGLKIGIKSFDELTQGFQKGQYYVVGGRASSGKTALADQGAVYLVNKGIPFLYVGLEGSKERIMGEDGL